jgi:hypothetical protein
MVLGVIATMPALAQQQRPDARRDFERDRAHKHWREIERRDPSWRPWLREERCTDARGVRFVCRR